MRKGFTLIEMALSLVVLSVGMFALVRLFSDGAVRGRGMTGDARAAFFAADVFDTLRTRTRNTIGWTSNRLDWVDSWDRLAFGFDSLLLSWPDHEVRLRAAESNAPPTPLVFTNFPGTPRERISHTFRYRIEIEPPGLEPADGPDYAAVRVHVWEGARGPETLGAAVSFYSEFPRTGETP